MTDQPTAAADIAGPTPGADASVARDLISECERRVSRTVSGFESLCPSIDTVFAMRAFVTSTLLASLCGMTVARAGQDLTADNIETAARELLEAMLPTLRKAAP